jgi:hypothetical protein
MILENKEFQNFKLSKNQFNKNVLLNYYSSLKKKIRKIQMADSNDS